MSFSNLKHKHLQLLSKEECVTCVAGTSSSLEMSNHVSSSPDWSQPVTLAEESLQLKWDDDDDDNSDDDQSQRPLEMKIDPTKSAEKTNDGKLCPYSH